MDAIVERSLRGAHLWDEVKDRLDKPGSGLSGGQQQRLCIARATAVEPEVLLMDEPCSALDPVATLAIEDLIQELKQNYTIAIVTHNMQQASPGQRHHRLLQPREERRPGRLVEIDETEKIFSNPTRRRPRTTSAGGSAERRRRCRRADSSTRRSSTALEERALGGLDLVAETLDRTLEAVEHQDMELAQIVIADDDQIDGRYLEVHQCLITLLATQSPVATDLRLISALCT